MAVVGVGVAVMVDSEPEPAVEQVFKLQKIDTFAWLSASQKWSYLQPSSSWSLPLSSSTQPMSLIKVSAVDKSDRS